MTTWGKFLRTSGVAGALMLGTAVSAYAGAFAIKERSTPLQGVSFAGASAGGGGFTSMGFNPAALGLVEGTELAGGISIIQPIADGTVRGADGSPTGEEVTADQIAGLGNNYIGHRLSDEFVIGVSVYTPFGLVSKYPTTFAGAGDGITSKLQTIQVSPTVAYQPIPGVTMAASVHVLYINARLTSSTAVLNGDQVNVGFAVGALWDVTDSTTIGAAYQHGYNNRLEGTAEGPITALLGAPGQTLGLSATAQLPATVSVGIVQGITDDFRLMAEGQWQNWEQFDRLDITIEGPGGDFTISDPQNYDNAFFFAIGGEYDVTEDLTLRTGFAWDETPTNAGLCGCSPVPTATNRTVRVPDEDRIWLSGGFSYDVSDHMRLDFGYSYLMGLDEPVVGLRTAPGSVEYDAGVHIFSIGGSMTF